MVNGPERGGRWHRPFAELRATPLVLRGSLVCFVVLLVASIICVVVHLRSAGDQVFGAFGVSVALLGIVLTFDLAGSARAMERVATAMPASVYRRMPRWAARQFRIMGGVYVLGGTFFAVIGFARLATWK